MPSISVSVPDGSSVQNLGGNYAEVALADAGLNGLASGSSTSAINYSSPSESSTAKVIIILGSVTLASSGAIGLDNGTDLYELTVASGSGSRRVEFNSIPSSFLASFNIVNGLGVSMASQGNTVSILPL
jgi:hypothetical protein